MTRTMTIAAAACALLLAWGAAAFAHHSTAMFDAENPIELTGTVTGWQFTNPHCVITLEVRDEDGETTSWTLEGMSPNVIYRLGWRPDSLQAGDRIIATVNPLRSGAAGGNYSDLRWADGTPIDPREGRPK